jgi:hypothetical protein
MQHPALTDLLEPIRLLYDDVRKKVNTRYQVLTMRNMTVFSVEEPDPECLA